MNLVFGKEVISCVPKLEYIKSENRGSNMSDLVLLDYRGTTTLEAIDLKCKPIIEPRHVISNNVAF